MASNHVLKIEDFCPQIAESLAVSISRFLRTGKSQTKTTPFHGLKFET